MSRETGTNGLNAGCRLVLVLCCCWLVGCRQAAVVRIDDSYNGGSVTVPVGARLLVVLDANPDSGYLWEIEDIDESILSYESKRLIRQNVSSQSDSSLHREFTFRALRAGRTRLEMDFMSTQEDEEPTGAFDVVIVVE
jgi:predicted secreted protein